MRFRHALIVLVAALAAGCSAGADAAGVAAAPTASSHPAAPQVGSWPPVSITPTPSATPLGKQLITVVAPSFSSTTATFIASQQVNGAYKKVFGPWTAHVAYDGIAPVGQKHEGDLKTPAGDFSLGFMFGVEPNPGVKFPYRRAFSFDKWDDDPSSANYNEWVDDRFRNPGANPESMTAQPFYDYGAVINYNSARTPGRGSAVFLHVDTGVPTTGCVSIPVKDLLKVLRWLDPKRSPHIQIKG